MMLAPTTRSAAWDLLWTLQLTPELFRFLKTEAAPKSAPSNFLFSSFASGRALAFGAALAAGAVWYQLQIGLSTGDVRELFASARVIAVVGALRKSLKMSNEETDAMRQILDGITPLLADVEPTVAKMKRFLAGPQSGWSRQLLQSLGESGYLTDRIHWLQERFAQLELEDVAPPPLLNGDMLTNAGLTPGAIFRRLLDAVYDAQLENRVNTSQEALALALELAGKGMGSV
jgi:hypothetical protein